MTTEKYFKTEEEYLTWYTENVLGDLLGGLDLGGVESSKKIQKPKSPAAKVEDKVTKISQSGIKVTGTKDQLSWHKPTEAELSGRDLLGRAYKQAMDRHNGHNWVSQKERQEDQRLHSIVTASDIKIYVLGFTRTYNLPKVYFDRKGVLKPNYREHYESIYQYLVEKISLDELTARLEELKSPTKPSVYRHKEPVSTIDIGEIDLSDLY